MKLSSTLLAACFGLATAHGDHEGQHIPKIVGGRKLLADIKMRRAMANHDPVVARKPVIFNSQSDNLEKRQGGVDGQCGSGVGSCATGYCCSAEGWCGKSVDYCSAPDCQLNYGTGCDGNKKPSGLNTAEITRKKVGSMLYGGAGIYDCVVEGDIALTFDDGPYLYTNDLLDKLKSYGAKATFFMTGNNLGKGMINDPASIYPAIIRRMHAEGHQIASHTWSHQNASQLTNTQFTNQMVWNEIAINSILGFFPTYMRPPYSICEKNCQNILSTLGYHAIYFDLDTAGYLNDSPSKIQASKNIWDQAIKNSDSSTDSFLQIEHDIHQQTVYNLTDYILTSLLSNGYKSVTVGECLGDPAANWYRSGPAGSVSSVAPVSSTIRPTSTSTSTTTTSTRNTRSTALGSPTATPTVSVSKDGSCGKGVTCTGSRFGTCCSTLGFCGTTDDYCLVQNGCQAAFGSCQGSASSTSSTAKPTSTSSTVVSQPTGLVITTDGLCGKDAGETCAGSSFGTCCGPNNKCASNTISCLGILGCQKDYGYCI
ncbi:hypothetical protein B0T22DRAFT_17007 [Podospora appendiculata]|uniref:Carbohydrate Esterase Family 4 n=1 Tax=Podospora appendiculata TaxID=314037 RepID=A0AAE0XFY5_9PEZI|nr:hypothetical protein B0T22DRAFT_17007 [Podospora appendiculata]